MLDLADDQLERVDVIELNLAAARQIPACRHLDVGRYRRTVDEWAAQVGREVERHRYRFEADPGSYHASWAYFCALMMRTVLDQDFGIGYDLEGFSFQKPADLFVHGIIDQRRGTCISLPVLQVAIGQRLGWPIRAVAVPGHTFCRWDDPATGQRLNIEAANTRGLLERDDEHYRHWPFELDPRWEREHHNLTNLSMRQYASVMIGALAAHFEAAGDRPAALRFDGLALWLDPASRSAFISLRLGMDRVASRYLDADELAGRKEYWEVRPHPSLHQQLAAEEKAAKTAQTQPTGAGALRAAANSSGRQ